MNNVLVHYLSITYSCPLLTVSLSKAQNELNKTKTLNEALNELNKLNGDCTKALNELNKLSEDLTKALHKV